MKEDNNIKIYINLMKKIKGIVKEAELELKKK